MDTYMTGRNLRVVAGVLAFMGTLYAVTAAMCIVRHDFYGALVAFLVFNISVCFAVGLAESRRSNRDRASMASGKLLLPCL